MCDEWDSSAHEKVGYRIKNDQKTGRGISLLELIVVLSIVSIMAAIALPNMSRFVYDKALSQQTEQLATIISRAHDLAMEKGYYWRLSFNPAGKSWVCYGDQNGDMLLNPGEQSLGVNNLDRNVSFGSHAGKGPNGSSIPGDGISVPNDCLTFSPMGHSNSGSIYLKSKHSSYAIRVLSTAGVIRIWRYRSAWEVVK